MKITKVLFVVICTLVLISNASIVNDFLMSAKNFWPKTKDLSSEQDHRKLPAVHFELPEQNEEFIKEGLSLIGAPREALDLCTHRVVNALKKNCNQLNMEETGKLAVMMLNCQLENEGRQVFVCKPEMTLQQCTMGMDSGMHQTYNFMVNRAVGVCSALKQEQFRALAEITVNRLMQSAQSQFKAMNEAMKNQRRLSEMLIENMKDLNENDNKIKETQFESLDILKHTESLLEENLISLQQELELIHKSESKLSEIEKSTDEISLKHAQHTSELHEGHKNLLNDIDLISVGLKKNKQELVEHYHQTLEFLDKFKSVMLVLSNVASNIKSYVNSILETIQEVGFEMTDEFIAVIILNIVYFTCGMVFMLFIDAEKLSKNLLIGLFCFNNIAAYFKADVALFPSNIFVWLCFIALKFLLTTKQRFRTIKLNLPKYIKFNQQPESDDSDEEDDDSRRPITPVNISLNKSPAKRIVSPVKPLFSTGNTPAASLNRIQTTPHVKISHDDDNEVTGFFNVSHVSQLPKTSSSTVLTPRNTETPTTLNRPLTPAMRRVMASTPTITDRTGTPFQVGMAGRIQCQATTTKGQQCRIAAKPGMSKCRIHDY